MWSCPYRLRSGSLHHKALEAQHSAAGVGAAAGLCQGGRVWADGALTDGRQSARIAEGWEEAVAMLIDRQPLGEPIVTLGSTIGVVSPKDFVRLIFAVVSPATTRRG